MGVNARIASYYIWLAYGMLCSFKYCWFFANRMPLKNAIQTVVIAVSLLVTSAVVGEPLGGLEPENSFVSFDSERAKVSSRLACATRRVNQATGGLGALYSCIGGKAETVKFFVNEMPNSGGRVKSVKFLWTDYTKNVGEGAHADAAIAKQWAGHLADMYAPAHKARVMKFFQGNSNAVVESATHLLTYTYNKGPAADERMFVVTKK